MVTYLDLGSIFAPGFTVAATVLILLFAGLVYLAYRTKKPNLLNLFTNSFYPNKYHSFKKVSVGRVAQHMGLCVIAFVILTVFSLGFGFWTEVADPTVKWPAVTINDGVLVTDVQSPHYVDAAKGFVIDVTGDMSHLDKQETSVLLTKTQIIVKKSQAETRSYSLIEFPSIVLDDEGMRAIAGTLTGFLALILFATMLVMFGVAAFVFPLIYSLLGLLIAKLLKKKIKWAELYKLCLILFVPVYVVYSLIGLVFPIEVVKFSLTIPFLIVLTFILHKKW